MPTTHQALPDARNRHVLVSVNGRLVPRDQATVSVFDSGFLVGDGIWEGIRLHQGTLLHLDRHLDRLWAGAAATGLDLGMTREDLAAAITRTTDANGMTTDVHVRVMVTRGSKSTPAQHPDLGVGGPTLVIVAEHKVADPAVVAVGVRLHTSSVRRPPPDTLDQRLNSHSKLHEVVALIEATEAGADEALMLDTNGFVATCNSTNFFVVAGDEVWTSTGMHCLNGITRGLVIELCDAEGIVARQLDFTLAEAHRADEAFITGTFGGITPVNTIDGVAIGDGSVPGPVTGRLIDLYRAALDRASGPSR